MSYLNAVFQDELQAIREYHYQQSQLDAYNVWVIKYKEELDHLYHLFSYYYFLEYNDFVQLVYASSDHKSKCLNSKWNTKN